MTSKLRLTLLLTALLGTTAIGLAQRDAEEGAAPDEKSVLIWHQANWKLLITYDPEQLGLDGNALDLISDLETCRQAYRELAENSGADPDATRVEIHYGMVQPVAKGAMVWSLDGRYLAPPEVDWGDELGKAVVKGVQESLAAVQELTIHSERLRVQRALENTLDALRGVEEEIRELDARMDQLAVPGQGELVQQQSAKIAMELGDEEIKLAEWEARREAVREMVEHQRAQVAQLQGDASSGSERSQYDAAIVNEFQKLVHQLEESVAAARAQFQAARAPASDAARLQEELIKARIELLRAQQDYKQKAMQKEQAASAQLAELVEQQAKLQQQLAASKRRLEELKAAAKELEAQRKQLDQMQRERKRHDLQYEIYAEHIRRLQTEIVERKDRLRRLEPSAVQVRLLSR